MVWCFAFPEDKEKEKEEDDGGQEENEKEESVCGWTRPQWAEDDWTAADKCTGEENIVLEYEV